MMLTTAQMIDAAEYLGVCAERDFADQALADAEARIAELEAALSAYQTAGAGCNFCDGPMPCFCPRPADWPIEYPAGPISGDGSQSW